MGDGAAFGFIVLVIIIVIVIRGVRIVNQYERGVVFRLAKLPKTSSSRGSG